MNIEQLKGVIAEEIRIAEKIRDAASAVDREFRQGAVYGLEIARRHIQIVPDETEEGP